MNNDTAQAAGKVLTLSGWIPAEQLGITLPHEHLIVQGWDYQERNYPNSAYMELARFAQAGGKTLVEVSSIGRSRDPRFFKRLADRAGVQVVMGTGFYRDGWLPEAVHGMTVDAMTDVIVEEIAEGVDGTGLRAGIIGEVGVSRQLTTTEMRSLAAAARAQRITGAAITLHFEIGSAQAEYDHALNILAENGADLTHVAVGHLVSRPDNLELCQHLAGRGCFIEFDLFGQERWYVMNEMMQTHPDVQTSSIKGFLDNGLLSHLLISQNVNHVDLMTVNGGDGYVHLLKNVAPKIKSYGVTEAELATMMVTNPGRLLAFRRCS
jgi:phosphotriesterase-related protein